MHRAGPRRLILDVTSTARWVGAPVGILRVEHELARHALAKRPDIVLAFHDPALGPRPLRPQWAATVTGWNGTIDPIHFARLEKPLTGGRRWLPSRYPAMMALERRRLAAPSATERGTAEALQRLLLLDRIPPPFADAQGLRMPVVSPEDALGPPLSPGPDDILVSAGFDWLNKDLGALAATKARSGFRCVALCYDIIPLLHPECFLDHDVENFRRYWTAMFALAERIIVTSHRVEADIRGYCAAAGVRINDIAVTPLGCERPAPAGAGPAVLPAGPEPGRFALFVSTIEPRKGHAMLLRAWRRLLAEGVPQRHRFRLVFVGRRGWKVESLLREIDEAAAGPRMLLHLADCGDGELGELYRNAAFCLYPSLYEGFGLPIVEAFAHGKAVLASTGGAVPETVGGLSPCLDPTDEDAWCREIRRWIEDPAARQPYEDRIRTSFSHPTWDEAASRFFAAASGA